MNPKKYLQIVSHYESCLAQHGDTHLGVDWPRQEDADARCRVMLDLLRPRSEKVSLLDFGCGASYLLEYINKHGVDTIAYSGLDLSAQFIRLSQSKFPATPYYHLDVLEDSGRLPSFDYVVMNGVFTEKRGLTFDEMLAYFKNVIRALFPKVNVGLAFNVMSKHVDWEREDLYEVMRGEGECAAPVVPVEA